MKLETRYKKILAMPDSPLKLSKLENCLLRLQPHGSMFFDAQKEWRRLFDLYRNNNDT